MKVELFPFQRKAVDTLRINTAMALNNYRMTSTPQVVSFTAPTGSGKTIIMAALIEDIYFGTEKFEEQPEAIFVWLSDSPQLNEQSKQKIDMKADKIRLDQCVVIEDESFDREMLEDGHIYFLNTQKIGKAGNLTSPSETRQYTIWKTLENTAREKSDRLYFIIDEAHRGMQGREAGKATSIMQKFLKGSPADKLSPMPVVIGMSATMSRFNTLVEGTTSTVHKAIVTAAEVRASGLLKDRIVITYPEDYSVHNDMAILQAATDEWKDKCLHWYQYSAEQHYAQVHPVFVIQVKSGSTGKLSDTDLDECLAKIEERIGYRFAENEVVHTFGQAGMITVHGLNVPHVEASDIADDKRIHVVFFKENLSTGWDCPRAETMMSFRHAEDSTYIAQLLGRMVRTPLQMRVQVDESLNDVHLYLPYFNEETVKEVIDSLQSTEGGDIPTVVEGEAFEDPNYTTWTTRPTRYPTGRKTVIDDNQMSLFDASGDPFHPEESAKPNDTPQSESPAEPPVPAPSTEEPLSVSETPTVAPVAPAPVFEAEPAQPSIQLSLAGISIDRDGIMKFINQSDLLTYEVKSVRIYSYLASMLKLARLLSQANISADAMKKIEKDMVGMIRAYIERLKASGKYEEYAGQVLQFKLSTQIFDVFGETVDNYAVHSLFTTTDTDLDRQLRNADTKLGSFGIANEYGRKYYDPDDPNAFKIDVILFAADDECIAMLNKYAEETFHALNDENRKYVNALTEKYRKQYHDIIADGDLVSKHSFRLPETLRARQEKDGKPYENHLFVNDDGVAMIKLNGWEEGVLEEEAKQPDFVCWIRNLPHDQTRATCSLCIPYEIDGITKSAFPDFLIVRSNPTLGYVIDILEPHSPDFKDNLGKAKGFAKYAEENIGIGRIQLIRMGKDAAGKNRFKRLDMAMGAVRQKVLKAQNNDELDHIFDTDGFFM